MSYNQIFQEANSAYDAGQFDKAETLYRQILQISPDNPDILNMLGLIAQAKHLRDAAIAYFLQAVRQAPQQIAFRFNLAAALNDAGQLTEAATEYQQVLKIKPDIKEAYNNLGGIYEKQKRPELAKEYYRKALKIDPEYLEAAVNLAFIRDDTSTLILLKEKHPSSELPPYYLALHFYHLQQYQAALSEISDADMKNKQCQEIKLLYANINLKLNKKEEAAEKFHETLCLSPKCVEALIHLAELENHEPYYLQALALDPDNLAAHAGYAALLYQQKRPAEALEEYRKAVILNPDLPDLSNNIGLILKDMGDYMQALDLFLNAFVLNPKIPEISVNLAETLVLLHRENPSEAVKIARQWLAKDPENAFAKHTLDAFVNKSSSCDSLYSEQLFDNFADRYDAVMENLKYNVLQTIKEMHLKFNGRILDLGCGTGIAGKFLKSAQNHFTGVDISQKMLSQARKKNVYDDLIKADITTFLRNAELNFDVVLALDVLDYTENIGDVIRLVFPRPFIFTIENSPETVSDFHLTPAGRYQHNPFYVETLLQTSGYQDIKKQTIVLRQENEQDVMGTIFLSNIFLNAGSE